MFNKFITAEILYFCPKAKHFVNPHEVKGETVRNGQFLF